MKNLRVCPIHNFIGCGLDGIVTREYKKTGRGCVAEIADKLKEENPDKYHTLEKDFFNLGWKFTHITDSIKRFESEIKNKPIFKTSNQEPIFELTSKNNSEFWLNPFVIEEDELIRENYFHVRGSEFHSKCPLQILFSTLDQNKIGTVKSDLTESGHARHEIAAGDCDHGKHIKDEHRERFNISTKLYSEKKLEYVLKIKNKNKIIIPEDDKFFKYSKMEIPDKIILRGTADYVFHVGNDKNSIVIWDNKRYQHRFYEKNSTKFQMLGYALAIEQYYNLNTDKYYLISEHRPGNDRKSDISFPKFHGTLIKKNDHFIKKFHTEILRHYFIKKTFIDDTNVIKEVYDYMHAPNKNSNKKCSTLFGNIPCMLLDYHCDRILNIIYDKNLESLFITPFK